MMMSFNTLTRVHCEEEILYYILSESPRRVIYTYMCIHVYVYWLFMEWIKRERKKWWGYWWESECGVYIERKKVSGRNMTETPPELLLMLWKKKIFFLMYVFYLIFIEGGRERQERGGKWGRESWECIHNQGGRGRWDPLTWLPRGSVRSMDGGER